MNGNGSSPGTSCSSTANHTFQVGVYRLVTARQDLNRPCGFFRAIDPRFGVNARGILHVIDFPNGDGSAGCGRNLNDIKTADKARTLESPPEISGVEPWRFYSKGSTAI